MPEDDTQSTTSVTRRAPRRRTTKTAEGSTSTMEQAQLPAGLAGADATPAADTPAPSPAPRRRRTRAASALTDGASADAPVVRAEPTTQTTAATPAAEVAQAGAAQADAGPRRGGTSRTRAPRKRTATATSEASGSPAPAEHETSDERTSARAASERPSVGSDISVPTRAAREMNEPAPYAARPAAIPNSADGTFAERNGAHASNGFAGAPSSATGGSGYDGSAGQPGVSPWGPTFDRGGPPAGQMGQQQGRRFGEPRAGRFNRSGQGVPANTQQPGSQGGRMRFDRPAPANAPTGTGGRASQDGGHPRQNQGQQQGMHPRDRRPLQHPGHGNRQLPPQRGQGGQSGQQGQGRNNDRNRGGYGQNGYIVPGYGVPGYGQPPAPYPNQGRPTGRVRTPMPPAPVVPVKTVDVQGVLWIRGNTAELLDERNTLTPIATLSFGDVQRMGLRAGDVIKARAEERGARRQVVAYESVNEQPPETARERPIFEQLTAISPRQRITLEHGPRPLSCRIIDLFAPLGFGARALVVAPPKTGKTTFLRETAEAVLNNYPDVLVMACLVGERPEEVTDLRAALEPRGGLVYAASFDEVQERHAWLVQVTIERAKRVAESGRHVVVLLDSLTRLARAENMTGRAMGRTLSGGIDAQALDTGRRAFGAARCLEEGGSLTIMATCLVDTGSRQDDVVYEEFKGTGNMEIYLSRDLAQRRLFPAVDAVRSGTRKEELLLTPEELLAATRLRRHLADLPLQAANMQLLDALEKVPSNEKLVQIYLKSTVSR